MDSNILCRRADIVKETQWYHRDIIKRCLSGYPVDKKIPSITEKSANLDRLKRSLATGGRQDRLTTTFYDFSGGDFGAISSPIASGFSAFTSLSEETGASVASFW